MKYKANVGKEKTYEVQTQPDTILLNNQEITLDLRKINDHIYHIIRQNQSAQLEILEASFTAKKFIFKVNGKLITIVLKDSLDQLVEQMGMHAVQEATEQEVKAPMPGLILHVAVQEGQTVKAGDPLFTLEAMKMENVIKSPLTGEVTSVRVKAKQGVEKNQLLAVIG